MSNRIIEKFSEEQGFVELLEKLQKRMDSSFVYEAPQKEMIDIISNMLVIAYKKGRTDENYTTRGPQISLYDKK